MENTYEQEIDLKDMIFYALHKWRLVIAIAIVLAVLLGGYKLGKGIIEKQNETQIAEIQKQYDTDLKDYEQKKAGYERSIENLMANIAFEQNYQQNSVLQKLDPYNKWVATADVFIKMDEQVSENVALIVDPADSVLRAYESGADKGNNLIELSREKGIELNYLKELINVEADYGSNMITITTSGEDQDSAKEILNSVLTNIKDSYSDIQEHLGAYSYVIINQSVNKVADIELAENQKNRISNLDSIQKSLDDTQAKLNKLKEPVKPSSLSLKGILKTSVKYGILGGILGVLIIGFYYCVIFVMSGKVNSSEELKNRFAIKILGAFACQREKKALYGIDNWLDKLEGKEFISEDKVYQRIISNISNYTSKEQTVLITGTVNNVVLMEFKEKLKELLPELYIEAGWDMNKNPETLTKIPKADGIILVEKCGISKYNEIKKELESIYSLDKTIIGCILL